MAQSHARTIRRAPCAARSDPGEATPEQVGRHFKRGRAAAVRPMLEPLTALGQARTTEDGKFAA